MSLFHIVGDFCIYNLYTFSDGITFHSAFGLKVGNSICYLSDKKRAELRENLSELKLVIIDEISMVGADMLYRIHLRLCTIFNTDEFLPFANVNIMLVGDLLQLPPVLGLHVFREPKNEALKAAYNGLEKPLWEECQPMILKHNHRQGESREWAETLNRIREGILTEKDEATLRERITDEKFLVEDALHTFYKNKNVTNHNKEMLDKLLKKLLSAKAGHALPKGQKPYINQGKGTIGNTDFMETFEFKIGARCMMIYNVDLMDDLFNGASGTIIGVEFDKKDQVECIIVQFDKPSWGRNQRERCAGYAKKYASQNGTPIYRYEHEYQLSGRNKKYGHAANGKLFQFPLRLNYALTSHKMQVIF